LTGDGLEDQDPPLLSNPPERVELKRSARKESILEASLVLASQSIKHWIEFDGRDFILTLERDDAPRSAQALEQYEIENKGFNLSDAENVPPLELNLSPLLHLLIPIAVFFWAERWQPWITRRGGADAGKILAGEWWRCVTATSLHADHEHLLSNMLSGFFILNLLRRRCGPGTSMILLTLAAALANFFVALASDQNHFSLGFSTVVFAGLGLLAGVETLHLPKHPLGGLRQISPLLAALCLAVFVGIGANIDVKGHFFGFGIGALFSPLVSRMEKRLSAPPWQILGVGAVYALYAVCWMFAQR
jgi:rhomboid protease GluP